eukprot:gb/GEZN01007138.1/.p1 GENE.gb/GEZN01007138.1/~~gb/GEZN01007138.1/.p1  ORF type:complete len:475 (+),score=88.44 gb/GEZN01007138.1/:137-1561(+)
MKLWEFLGNGGRVGLIWFPATHWASHESGKKQQLVHQGPELSGSGQRQEQERMASSKQDHARNSQSQRTSAQQQHADVLSLFRWVRRLSPTCMSCPPNIWHALKQLSDETQQRNGVCLFGPRVSFLATGGAPTHPDLQAWAKALFPTATFVDSYGTTETGAISSNGAILKDKGVKLRLREVRGFSAKDKPFPRGELEVCSPNQCVGYIGDQEATERACLSDGWLRTGDLVSYNPDTRTYKVLERMSAVFSLSSGAVVFPSRLEESYLQSPLFDQVLVAPARLPNSGSAAAARSVANLSNTSVASCGEEKAETEDSEGLLAYVVLNAAALAQARAAPVSTSPLSASWLLPAIRKELALRHPAWAKTQGVSPPLHVVVSPEPWTVQNGLMTSTFKVKRKEVLHYLSDRPALPAHSPALASQRFFAQQSAAAQQRSNAQDGNQTRNRNSPPQQEGFDGVAEHPISRSTFPPAKRQKR